MQMIDIVASNQDNPKWYDFGNGVIRFRQSTISRIHWCYTSMRGLWLAIMRSINVTYYLMMDHVRVNVAILHQFSVKWSDGLCVCHTLWAKFMRHSIKVSEITIWVVVGCCCCCFFYSSFVFMIQIKNWFRNECLRSPSVQSISIAFFDLFHKC